MPAVITEGSTVTCSNQGTVRLTASQSKLKVGGKGVLVEGDFGGASVSGCTTVTDPQQGSLQCTATLPSQKGKATKLKVSGKAVLLESAGGKTAGTVGGTPQTWSVQSAGQTKLQSS